MSECRYEYIVATTELAITSPQFRAADEARSRGDRHQPSSGACAWLSDSAFWVLVSGFRGLAMSEIIVLGNNSFARK